MRVHSWPFERQQLTFSCIKTALSLLIRKNVLLVVDWIFLNAGAAIADLSVHRLVPLLNVQNQGLFLLAPAHLLHYKKNKLGRTNLVRFTY